MVFDFSVAKGGYLTRAGTNHPLLNMRTRSMPPARAPWAIIKAIFLLNSPKNQRAKTHAKAVYL